MTTQHYNNPANIAHAELVIKQWEKRGITLEVIVNHWGLKQVILHCPKIGTRIANRASFNSFWSDADVITDVDTLSFIEDTFAVNFSEGETETKTTQAVISSIKDALNSGYAEVANLATAYGLDHVCFEYKYSGLLYSVTVIDSLLTYVIIENTRKGQRELTKYSATINGCEQSALVCLITKFV